MICDVLTLIQTLFDIIRLRKGPEAIPHSPVLLIFVVAAWLAAGAIITMLIDELDQTDFVVSVLTGLIALMIYSVVVVFSRHSSRLLQTITAILGCGALLEFTFAAGHVFLTMLIGKNLAALINYLILLWSVPVEGHIIARATNRHWAIGLLIAAAVFLIQIQLGFAINPVDPVSP